MDHRSWTALLETVANLPQSDLILFDELVVCAARYARARLDWRLAGAGEKPAMDQARTRAHDRFIDACNALSRACVRAGQSTDWRAVWGPARTGEERKRIGDFACFIAYRLMLEAR